MRLCSFAINSMNLYQLTVVTIRKSPLLVQEKGDTTRHACAEIEPSDVAAEDLLLFDCSLLVFFIAALLSPTAAAAAIAAQCSASEEVMRMTVLVTIVVW